MREGGIRYPHDLVALALEDRNAWHRAVVARRGTDLIYRWEP
jgi:hypothetical protein